MDDAPDAARYHLVARILHWTMLVALAAQFLLGVGIDRADDLLEWPVELWLGGEDDALVFLHVGLGGVILALATIRVLWRVIVGLPPWAPGLTDRERRIAHRAEQVLYLSMFLIPLTGIALVAVSGEDWQFDRWVLRGPVELVDDDVLLGTHITAQVAFLAALVIHVALVLKHQLVDRDGLLRRMW